MNSHGTKVVINEKEHTDKRIKIEEPRFSKESYNLRQILVT